MASSEQLKKADSALKSSAQMTRYRALETMEDLDYNPVKKLIELTQTMEKSELRDYELEMKIHTKLLEYYSAAPKKQLSLDVQQNMQIAVMPVSYAHMYEGRNLEACKPKLIDVTPVKSVLEEYMGDAASDSGS